MHRAAVAVQVRPTRQSHRLSGRLPRCKSMLLAVTLSRCLSSYKYFIKQEDCLLRFILYLKLQCTEKELRILLRKYRYL